MHKGVSSKCICTVSWPKRAEASLSVSHVVRCNTLLPHASPPPVLAGASKQSHFEDTPPASPFTPAYPVAGEIPRDFYLDPVCRSRGVPFRGWESLVTDRFWHAEPQRARRNPFRPGPIASRDSDDPNGGSLRVFPRRNTWPAIRKLAPRSDSNCHFHRGTRLSKISRPARPRNLPRTIMTENGYRNHHPDLLETGLRAGGGTSGSGRAPW